MPESDRDLLIRIDERTARMHVELLGEDGRVPKLEDTTDRHAAQINTFTGGMSAIKWVLGGIGLALLTLGATVLAHVLGGGK